MILIGILFPTSLLNIGQQLFLLTLAASFFCFFYPLVAIAALFYAGTYSRAIALVKTIILYLYISNDTTWH